MFEWKYIKRPPWSQQLHENLKSLWCHNSLCKKCSLCFCLTWRCPQFELHPGPVRTERAAPAPRAVFGLERARSASPWSPPERCRTEKASRWRSVRDQSLPKLAFSNPTDMKCTDRPCLNQCCNSGCKNNPLVKLQEPAVERQITGWDWLKKRHHHCYCWWWCVCMPLM